MIEWRAVVGYEGLYEVSNSGIVRSLDGGIVLCRWGVRRRRGRTLAQSDQKTGLSVTLFQGRDRKQRYVHQLVLEAFVGPRPPGTVCCHWDGNFRNNNVENLRWDSVKANASDAVRHGTRGPKKTCKHGHPFNESNTYISRGRRYCRTCRLNNMRAFHARRNARV